MVDDLGDDGEFACVRSIVDENHSTDFDKSLEDGLLILTVEHQLASPFHATEQGDGTKQSWLASRCVHHLRTCE